jgi:hypothetical protein
VDGELAARIEGAARNVADLDSARRVPSSAHFVFARHPAIPASALATVLRVRAVLVGISSPVSDVRAYGSIKPAASKPELRSNSPLMLHRRGRQVTPQW